MNKNKIKIFYACFIFFLSTLLTGCSYLGVVSYPHVLKDKKAMMAEGSFDQAFESLEEGARYGNNKVLYLLEQGTIRHVQGNYKASLDSFNQALSLIQDFEDRAVVSARGVASQLLTLPLNDNTIPYYGYPFERVIINTYQALNYLFLGDLEGAGVEVRRADQRQTRELERHNKEVSEYQKWGRSRGVDLDKYQGVQKVKKEMNDLTKSTLNSFQNAFTYYLSGIIYELNGEENDAYIDYKKACQLAPDFFYVQADLLRLSQKLGFEEEYAEWSVRFPGRAKEDEEDSSGRGAEIILFYGSEFIAQKQEIKLTIPINKTLVSIAIPSYSRESIQPGENFFITAFEGGSLLGTTNQVLDLDTLSAKSLEEQLPIILIRQIARVLTKTAVSREARGNGNDLAFIATSLYNILSENADLRNWLLLPDNIQVLRKHISAGRHEFTWQLQSRSGQRPNVQRASVDLQDGDVCLVNLRSMEGRLFSNLKIIHQPH